MLNCHQTFDGDPKKRVHIALLMPASSPLLGLRTTVFGSPRPEDAGVGGGDGAALRSRNSRRCRGTPDPVVNRPQE